MRSLVNKSPRSAPVLTKVTAGKQESRHAQAGRQTGRQDLRHVQGDANNKRNRKGTKRKQRNRRTSTVEPSKTHKASYIQCASCRNLSEPDVRMGERLAQLAYDRSAPEDYMRIKAKCFSAVCKFERSANRFLVGVRGTQSIDEVLVDVAIKLEPFDRKLPGQGLVHSGFLTGAHALWPELESHLRNAALSARDQDIEVIFSGHSLGGAIVTILAVMLQRAEFSCRVLVVTLGAPPVGDEDFRTLYHSLGILTLRLTNRLDCVPLSLNWHPSFVHMVSETCLDAHLLSRYLSLASTVSDAILKKKLSDLAPMLKFHTMKLYSKSIELWFSPYLSAISDEIQDCAEHVRSALDKLPWLKSLLKAPSVDSTSVAAKSASVVSKILPKLGRAARVATQISAKTVWAVVQNTNLGVINNVVSAGGTWYVLYKVYNRLGAVQDAVDRTEEGVKQLHSLVQQSTRAVRQDIEDATGLLLTSMKSIQQNADIQQSLSKLDAVNTIMLTTSPTHWSNAISQNIAEVFHSFDRMYEKSFESSERMSLLEGMLHASRLHLDIYSILNSLPESKGNYEVHRLFELLFSAFLPRLRHFVQTYGSRDEKAVELSKRFRQVFSLDSNACQQLERFTLARVYELLRKGRTHIHLEQVSELLAEALVLLPQSFYLRFAMLYTLPVFEIPEEIGTTECLKLLGLLGEQKQSKSKNEQKSVLGAARISTKDRKKIDVGALCDLAVEACRAAQPTVAAHILNAVVLLEAASPLEAREAAEVQPVMKALEQYAASLPEENALGGLIYHFLSDLWALRGASGVTIQLRRAKLDERALKYFQKSGSFLLECLLCVRLESTIGNSLHHYHLQHLAVMKKAEDLMLLQAYNHNFLPVILYMYALLPMIVMAAITTAWLMREGLGALGLSASLLAFAVLAVRFVALLHKEEYFVSIPRALHFIQKSAPKDGGDMTEARRFFVVACMFLWCVSWMAGSSVFNSVCIRTVLLAVDVAATNALGDRQHSLELLIFYFKEIFYYSEFEFADGSLLYIIRLFYKVSSPCEIFNARVPCHRTRLICSALLYKLLLGTAALNFALNFFVFANCVFFLGLAALAISALPLHILRVFVVHKFESSSEKVEWEELCQQQRTLWAKWCLEGCCRNTCGLVQESGCEGCCSGHVRRSRSWETEFEKYR